MNREPQAEKAKRTRAGRQKTAKKKVDGAVRKQRKRTEVQKKEKEKDPVRGAESIDIYELKKKFL